MTEATETGQTIETDVPRRAALSGRRRGDQAPRGRRAVERGLIDHRRLGVDLFNEVWRLLESREDDDRMLHAAHASRYHWGEATECRPENLARGEWQVSRVYAVLGRGEPAIWHAQRCVEHCETSGIGDWDLAYAYEALSRAHGVAGGAGEAARFKELAREAGDRIADPEDREHFDEDYLTLP